MKRIVLFWLLYLMMLCVTAQAEEGTMRTVFFGSFPQQGSEAEPIEWYEGIQVGDTVTVTGSFHILSNDWGVVLKNSTVTK